MALEGDIEAPDLDKANSDNRALSSAHKVRAVTPGGGSLPEGVCRALLVNVAGTATIIDASDAQVTDVPLQQGYNPLRVKAVLAFTGSGLFALY